MLRCECGSLDLYYDRERAELVCQECGLVVEESLATAEAHYVRFTSSDHSEPLSISPSNPVNRLKVKSHPEKRLEAIYHEIKHKPVPQDVKDRAFWLAKKYLRIDGRLPVHSIKDFADALVYLASREKGVPYQPKVRFKFLMRIKRHLAEAGVAVWNSSIDPMIYLDRIVSGLSLGSEVYRKAAEIMDSITFFTPPTRAAVSVVLALEELGKTEVVPSWVARSAGISASTLCKARKRLQGVEEEESNEKRFREEDVVAISRAYYFPKRLAIAFCLTQEDLQQHGRGGLHGR